MVVRHIIIILLLRLSRLASSHGAFGKRLPRNRGASLICIHPTLPSTTPGAELLDTRAFGSGLRDQLGQLFPSNGLDLVAGARSIRQQPAIDAVFAFSA
jgi:hypothetical protein